MKVATFARSSRLLLPALSGAALLLFVAEALFPLRRRVEPRGRRTRCNALLAALSGISVRWVVLPGLLSMASFCERKKLGLLPALRLRRRLRSLTGVLLLDLGIYTWHRMNHQLPLLWRFHRVHHADLDVDLSTAFRFHPGEVLGSLPVRGLQIALLGPSPRALLAYELLLQTATAFHHSNLKLPLRLEQALSLVLVTPRLHGAHHSGVTRERNNNFGVVFSVWDRMLGSLSARFAEQPANLGLSELTDSKELGAIRMLVLPFHSFNPQLGRHLE